MEKLKKLFKKKVRQLTLEELLDELEAIEQKIKSLEEELKKLEMYHKEKHPYLKGIFVHFVFMFASFIFGYQIFLMYDNKLIALLMIILSTFILTNISYPIISDYVNFNIKKGEYEFKKQLINSFKEYVKDIRNELKRRGYEIKPHIKVVKD